MKNRKERSATPIRAAGGIVVRSGRQSLIAVVQLRKANTWVLPKGKLDKNETAIAAARREVLEEVGHEVEVRDFLGAIAHDVGERPKVVQFWAMRALDGPTGRLAQDVKAVEWLTLDAAIGKLTHAREQEFLRTVGATAIEAAERATGDVAHHAVTAVEPPPALLGRLGAWWRRMIGGRQAA